MRSILFFTWKYPEMAQRSDTNNKTTGNKKNQEDFQKFDQAFWVLRRRFNASSR